ncbi:hypothetical protein NDU88_007553 [Pleurodeles waltl]|uniref:Ig-like domain-containing protein n=1 Tax=Pleurodeles waltl TaxID=8319 RepID=A0AAV7MG33_PLEWA|nr:hypothetical protein NDU88_007553 [Pleurodeles waltl]
MRASLCSASFDPSNELEPPPEITRARLSNSRLPTPRRLGPPGFRDSSRGSSGDGGSGACGEPLTRQCVKVMGEAVDPDSSGLDHVCKVSKLIRCSRTGVCTHRLLCLLVCTNQRQEDLLITPPYAKKVEFFTSNGSLLLRNVQAADSGVYKVTINLREDEARLIELIIVGPLPHPEIHCNFSLAGSPAEIFCDVPWGEVDSIEWKKDGDSLPHDTCYQIKNRSVLYISKLDPSHCTHYTCNVSNRFYWNESSYNLTFEGAPPTLHTARTFSAAALVTAVTCLLLLVIQFLLPQKILITSNVWRPYTIVLQSLASVASLLLAIAASIWMSQKGVSVAMVLLCVVLLFVVLATSMTVVVLLFCAEKPDFRKRNRGYRIILDSAAPGGVLLDVLFSCLLIEGINKLKGEGCSGVEDQRVLAAVVCLVPLVLGSCAGVFLWYHRKRESNEANDDGEMSEKETCQPIEGRDQPETPMVQYDRHPKVLGYT